MFRDLLLQELGYWLKRPVTYLFALTFCGFAFLMIAGTAGWFDPHVADGKIHEHLNSYFGLHKITQYLHKLMLILLPALVGSSLFRDYKYRVHSLLFAFPVRKTDYLLSRFSASFLVVIGIGSMVMLSMIIASLLPGLDPAKMGPFQVGAFLQAFLLYMIPNFLLAGALVFAIVLRFRNIYFAFIGTLLPFILQLIIENALIEWPSLIAVLDPFGQNTVMYQIKDWTLLQKNSLELPIVGHMLLNRILWVSTSFMIIGFSIKYFRLHQEVPGILRWLKWDIRETNTTSNSEELDFRLDELKRNEVGPNPLQVLWHMAKDGLIYLLKSPILWGTLALAIMAVLFAIGRVTQKAEMILMPITKIILMVPSAFYSVFCMLLVFIYSGLLIHRERNSRMNALVDCTPTPFWVYWSSKLLTMIQLELLLMVLFMLTGIIIQTTQGYHHYEVLLYVKYLIGITFPPLLIWTLAAFFIHTIIDNLYVALFVLLLGWVGVGGMPQLGIDTHLLRFNAPPAISYSDMNGFGHGTKAFFITQGYWLGFGVILLAFAHTLWPSGSVIDLRNRIKRFNKRISPGFYLSTIIGICIMTGTGILIWKGENARLAYTGKSGNQYLKQFKEEFEVYASLPIPKIQSVKATIDLYPEDQRFKAQGSYVIQNPHQQPMDTFMVRLGFDELSSFSLGTPFEIIAADSIMKCYVVKLKQSIQPYEKLNMTFNVQSQDNTLFERNSGILTNGTFLKNDIFPRLGYSYDEQWPHPDSVAELQVHYQSPDADLVDLDLIIGTSGNQQAIAPGKLLTQWQLGDRNYYQYTTEQPIKFSFGINSGQYQHRKTELADQSVEIYAHHTTNHPSMEAAIKATLAYQSKYFTAYTYDEVRLIEFPDSEGTYATAFANNVPTSEIRFITNTDPTGMKTDLSFYVPAHELIHHWWGATLIPARTLGATMLTESLTEYLSLQVYEEHFGTAAAHQFLELQHRRYWNGHKNESGIEPPLFLVQPEQQYISYGKGTVVMNGLSHLLGEETFNRFLSNFLESYGSSSPPYPTTVDFLDALHQKLPDSLRTFVTDQFKSVAYLEVQELEISTLTPSDIKVSGRIKKLELAQDDSSKTPVERPLDEWMQLDLFNSDDQLIKTQWIHLTDEAFQITLTSGEQPTRFEIDPNYLLLIKNREKARKAVH